MRPPLDPEIPAGERLYRRFLPGQWNRADRPKAVLLRLRPGEDALSFYRSSLCTAQQVRSAWPKPGARVAAFLAGLLATEFDVYADAEPADLALGAAHVSAWPRRTDADGQIPLDVRDWLAEIAEWVDDDA